ncbi:ATP-binding protein [Aeromicrobium sp. UC242_57]|uniref:ATP-binding protein n=1 Tax=Aeromicrobium sp. UC242_57 TaxID=3374624 RepID=UPI00378743D5
MVAATSESALLILGEPGLGKSHLLTQASTAASETVHTAFVYGRPAEASFELSGFAAFFDALRGEHQAAFGHHLVLRSDRPDRLFAAAQDLAELIQGLHLRPTVVFIDDIDEMDPLSQSLISILSGHLAGTNVRIVATAKSTPPAALSSRCRPSASSR